MKKTTLILSVFILMSWGLQAQTQILPEEQRQELYSKKSIRKIWQNEKEISLCLTPDTPLSHDAVETWNIEATPNTVSENLFIVSKEELKANSADPENADTSMEAVSKILRSISKMKGMEYFSNGDQKWETLYHQAYVCGSVKEKRKPLPDVTEGSADGLELLCFLEDNSFGKYVYSVKYKQNEKEISFCLENVEEWRFAMVPAIAPLNLKINMVVIDNEDSYIIYMILRANHTSVQFLADRLQRSLGNRIDAIFKWFTLQF